MQAQIVMPFDLKGSLSFSTERTNTGASQQRVNYSRGVPSQGGSPASRQWHSPG